VLADCDRDRNAIIGVGIGVGVEAETGHVGLGSRLNPSLRPEGASPGSIWPENLVADPARSMHPETMRALGVHGAASRWRMPRVAW
jgi:hypothetical protein